jgi:hypothetical protein
LQEIDIRLEKNPKKEVKKVKQKKLIQAPEIAELKHVGTKLKRVMTRR